MIDKWQFYKDTKGEWRWRRVAGNGRIVGAATEGYKNHVDCVANAQRNGWVEEVEADAPKSHAGTVVEDLE